MSLPLVSILIPTYKRAALVPQAIRSALEQTYPSIEVLILDDCSPDDTASACAQFTADPRVRYIRHETNQGLPRNWQFGIDTARGEFFTILHDDDALEPTFVKDLLAPLLGDPDLVLSFCDQWVMDAAGGRCPDASDQMSARFSRTYLPMGRVEDPCRVALVDCAISIAACLFRRAMVPSRYISELAGGSNDMWIFYQCLRAGHGAHYVPKRLANYRAHVGGMSVGAPLYMVDGTLFRLEAMLADSAMAPLHPQFRALRRRALADKGLHLVHLGRRTEARRVLIDSLSMGPTRRALGALALSVCGTLGTSIVRGKRRPGPASVMPRSPTFVQSVNAYADSQPTIFNRSSSPEASVQRASGRPGIGDARG
jgi:glycosyltransferase involved in cell wall biosynthesis